MAPFKIPIVQIFFHYRSPFRFVNEASGKTALHIHEHFVYLSWIKRPIQQTEHVRLNFSLSYFILTGSRHALQPPGISKCLHQSVCRFNWFSFLKKMEQHHGRINFRNCISYHNMGGIPRRGHRRGRGRMSGRAAAWSRGYSTLPGSQKARSEQIHDCKHAEQQEEIP